MALLTNEQIFFQQRQLTHRREECAVAIGLLLEMEAVSANVSSDLGSARESPSTRVQAQSQRLRLEASLERYDSALHALSQGAPGVGSSNLFLSPVITLMGTGRSAHEKQASDV